MLPNQFFRVQLRRVCREAFRDDFRMTRKIVADDTCTLMNVPPIPDDRQWAADMLVNLTQESHSVVGTGVGVIPQQRDVQVEALLLGADRDRSDGRYSVAPIPRLENWRFTTRGIRPPHRGVEHIAGFVEEHQRGVSGLGFFF